MASDIETTMKELAAQWQAVLNELVRGQPLEKQHMAVEAMLTVATGNLSRFLGAYTAANSLELTARVMRDTAAKLEAAATRPAADVIPIASRRR